MRETSVSCEQSRDGSKCDALAGCGTLTCAAHCCSLLASVLSIACVLLIAFVLLLACVLAGCPCAEREVCAYAEKREV